MARPAAARRRDHHRRFPNPGSAPGQFDARLHSDRRRLWHRCATLEDFAGRRYPTALRGCSKAMRILVTGGAGFIGSAVCRLLVGELGATVLNVDKLTYAANLQSLRTIENHPVYSFRHADICDRAAVMETVQAFKPDAIMHLAAESHVDRS